MELFFLIMLMFLIGLAIGQIDSFLKPFFANKKTTPPQPEKNLAMDNSSRIEAVKKQIERENISTATNMLASSINPPVLHEKATGNPVTSIEPKSIVPVQEKQVVKINIESNEIKSQAASEIVESPKGVVVKVTRTRIVEHSVNIEWGSAIAGKGEVGIKQLVSASIEREIQRVKGYALQQTESMEYEITLDGERHSQYQLIWMDVWLKGIAEIQEGNNVHQQPFQFRDRAELKVIPLPE